MDVLKNIEISLRDAYQLLISECRYGYTRNNHLMPHAAYARVKDILPKMAAVDKEYAIYTAKQLCEECISDQLTWNFFDGEEDEHGNRQEAIDFVKWLKDYILSESSQEFEPYNWDRFLMNLDRDEEKIYNVYEEDEKGVRTLLTEEPLAKTEYLDFICDLLLKDTGKSELTFNRQRIDGSHWDEEKHEYIKKPVDFRYHILSPAERTFYVEHIKNK